MKKNTFFLKYSLILIFLISCISVQILGQSISELEKRTEKYKQEGNFTQESQSLNRLVYLYWDNNQLEKATKCLTRLVTINENINNKNGLMTTYQTMGSIYADMMDYTNSYKAFENQIKYAKQLNKKREVITGTINAATALQNTKEHTKSIEYAERALEMSQQENDLKLIRTCYRVIAENYESMGDTDNMMKYFDLFAMFDKKIKKDQITDIESKSKAEVNQAQKATQAKEIELKHTVDTLREVKEKTEMQKMQIEVLNAEKKMKEIELKREQEKLKFEKKMSRIYIIGLFIFVVLSFVIFLQFRQKEKANNLLEQQNKKINQQNKQITDSISYAQTIQQAILPIEDSIKEHCDAFIIYKPKAIVSGDFYWFSSHPANNFFLIAAVDCTGHGVPGAFMSMIGNTLLNSIVNEQKITSPGEILKTLNMDTQQALKQEITDNSDGMDICLCKIQKDGDKRMVTFSGAKRPVFIYRTKEKALEQIRGDRISIGGYHKFDFEIKFTNHTFEVNPGDILYLGSDGFIDQNAPNRKRYGTKKLEKTLKEIGSLSITMQKESLENALKKHMNGEEQRDDITILGVKIK